MHVCLPEKIEEDDEEDRRGERQADQGGQLALCEVALSSWEVMSEIQLHVRNRRRACSTAGVQGGTARRPRRSSCAQGMAARCLDDVRDVIVQQHHPSI